MKHKRTFAVLVLAILLLMPCPVRAEEYPRSVQSVLDKSPVAVTADGEGFAAALLRLARETFFKAVERPMQVLVKLTVYLLLACLTVIASPSHQKLLGGIVCVGFTALCLNPVAQAVCDACESAASWHAYLNGFVPVMAGVLAAGGQTGQAAVYTGVFMTSSALLSQWIGSITLPLVRMYLCLSAAVSFWNDPGMNRLHHLLDRALHLVLRVAGWAFGLILGLQTLLARSGDQLAAKTGAALLTGLVPVVGSVAGQALQGVAAGLSLVKTLLGAAAIVTVSSMVLPVLIPVLIYCIGLLLTAALARSTGLPACAVLCTQLSDGLRLCLSCLVLYYFIILLSTFLMILSLGGT